SWMTYCGRPAQKSAILASAACPSPNGVHGKTSHLRCKLSARGSVYGGTAEGSSCPYAWPNPVAEEEQSMSELPGGTLTVLHTEIEGSTLLMVHLGDRYLEVLATHCALVRAAFATHEGHEVDTQGDSFFGVFPRATQAVAAAVAMQRALAAAAWPEGGAVRVRIGLHTGEPIRAVAGYPGVGVIRGARTGDAGHGGQVLLSKSPAALVEDALLDGLSLRDLGTYRLKTPPRPERIFQLIIPDLPADFPPLQSLDTPRRAP